MEPLLSHAGAHCRPQPPTQSEAGSPVQCAERPLSLVASYLTHLCPHHPLTQAPVPSPSSHSSTCALTILSLKHLCPRPPLRSPTCALALLFADDAQLHSQLADEELKEAEPTKHVAKLKGIAETKSTTNVKTETKTKTGQTSNREQSQDQRSAACLTQAPRSLAVQRAASAHSLPA